MRLCAIIIPTPLLHHFHQKVPHTSIIPLPVPTIKHPSPTGILFLPQTGRNNIFYSVVIPCPVLLIPDLLFHDDAGLELYLYPVRRDYFDAGNQPSDKFVVKFRYLAAVSAQESIHVLHPLFIVFSQLFLFPCLHLFFFQGIDYLRDPAVAFIKFLRISACFGISRRV